MKTINKTQSGFGIALLAITLGTIQAHALSFDSFMGVFGTRGSGSSTTEIRNDTSVHTDSKNESNVNGQVTIAGSETPDDNNPYTMAGQGTTSTPANVDAHTNALLGMQATSSDDQWTGTEEETSFFLSVKAWFMSLFNFSASTDEEVSVSH
jgi:imidazolonepropionase-like amidohydrolase